MKYIIRILFMTILLQFGFANAKPLEPIMVNATITSEAINFSPVVIPENTPFVIHVINQAGVPVELENSDTSVEIYDGTDKTFKIGLSIGRYRFFNDFNPKTKTADLEVVSANDLAKQSRIPINIVNSNHAATNGQSSVANIIFIMWRESIEALLVVGIVLGWLKQLKSGYRQGMLFLAGGVAIGVVWALMLGYALIKLSTEVFGNFQGYLQSGLTLLAAIMIVYMVKWMRSNGMKLKAEMQNSLSQNQTNKWNLSILFVVATAIAREGSEAVIFIYALGFGKNGTVSGSMFGALAIGILLAIITVYLLSLGNKIFSWRYFFKITEILLLLLGGAMLLNCIDTLVSIGFLPVLQAKFWDSSFILSDGGHFVPLLASIVGYRATPSLIDIIAYLLYWILVVAFIRYKKSN